jgi:CDP-diacylglycerol--glycerol-3-phosphate 3-phosphatidyltransferase
VANGSDNPRGGIVVRTLDRAHVTPNAITLFGFAGVCVSGGLIIAELWVAAAGVFITFGLFDPLDGHLARYQGTVSTFGAFLDSFLDRAAEAVIFGAVAVTFARDGNELGVLACFGAMAGSFLVSYARARAEGLGVSGGSGGLMGRPERLVLLGAGLFLGGVGSVLEVTIGIIAVLALLTAIERVLIVRRGAPPPAPHQG